MTYTSTGGLLCAAGLLAVCASPGANAADRYFLYNLTTAATFTGVYLAPEGTGDWGGNQALNDKDKSVDPSERLPIAGIRHGRFDVKLVDRKGRTCFARGIDLSKDTTFEIRDKNLTECE